MQNTKLIKKISTSLVSTGEIIDSLQSNSSTNAPSIRAVVDNMTPPMNLLINGDFKIWQRGETFTIKGDEAFHYTADMWCVYASTGQTIIVEKTTDGLQFRGTGAIMQRMSPLKVGQKYVFLCKVDGDFKTLSITGGTYTENSFLKYNKAGSYEQLQIKSNGITNVANARLWEGDTVYKIVEEDDAIALMRCQQYLRAGHYIGACIFSYGDGTKLFSFCYENMKSAVTAKLNINYFTDSGAPHETTNYSIDSILNGRVTFTLNDTTANAIQNGPVRIYAELSCEPL